MQWTVVNELCILNESWIMIGFLDTAGLGTYCQGADEGP